MEFDPENQEIIKLITKLKGASGEYPDQLLAARRQSYLKQMAEIGMGIGAGTTIENAAKNGSVPAASTSTAVSSLVETILVVAIVAEAGAAAYFYRGQLAKFFQTITAVARGEEVTPPPAVTTSLEIQGVSPSPIVTATLPTATISPSPSGTVVVQSSTPTPIPGVVNDNNPGINQTNSTPIPNGNNGNHYGQTPKPERTKQPQNNNDKLPKDNGNNNQPPDNQSKPTKTK